MPPTSPAVFLTLATALLGAAAVTGTFLGALPPVDLYAVCFVLRSTATSVRFDLLKCLRRGQLTWPSAAYVSLPQLLCCGVWCDGD